MCRFAGLLADADAPAPPLSALLFDPPHSLEHQSYAPEAMFRGHVNVDGTGVAWWDGGDPTPLRYVTASAPWADANLPALAARLRGRVQLAAVRSATPGLGHGTPFVAPFVHGELAGAHNGRLAGYPATFARPLLERLPDDMFAAYSGASDSLALFLTVAGHVAAGATLAEALTRTVCDVVMLARRLDAIAGLNIALASAQELVAVRAAHGEPSNSLYVLDHGGTWPAAVVLASEPLDDDPGWAEVAPASVVRVDTTGVAVTPLRGLE